MNQCFRIQKNIYMELFISYLHSLLTDSIKFICIYLVIYLLAKMQYANPFHKQNPFKHPNIPEVHYLSLSHQAIPKYSQIQNYKSIDSKIDGLKVVNPFNSQYSMSFIKNKVEIFPRIDDYTTNTNSSKEFGEDTKFHHRTLKQNPFERKHLMQSTHELASIEKFGKQSFTYIPSKFNSKYTPPPKYNDDLVMSTKFSQKEQPKPEYITSNKDILRNNTQEVYNYIPQAKYENMKNTQEAYTYNPKLEEYVPSSIMQEKRQQNFLNEEKRLTMINNDKESEISSINKNGNEKNFLQSDVKYPKTLIFRGREFTLANLRPPSDLPKITDLY